MSLKDRTHQLQALAKKKRKVTGQLMLQGGEAFAPDNHCKQCTAIDGLQKVDYWEKIFGKELEGRLGLFHFTQRIINALQKCHIDYSLAINALLNSVYIYNQQDYETLLLALKEGTLSGTKHTDEDIADMKSMKYFCQ